MGMMQGRGEIARGELMRHLAESMSSPAALLPGQGVVWTAVDDVSASATMTDGPIPSISADIRAARLVKTTVTLPGEYRMSNCQTQDGMRVPISGEVTQLMHQGSGPV